MYSYVIGIGCHNNRTTYVDDILEMTEEELKTGMLTTALSKPTKRTSQIGHTFWAMKLRSRFQMTDLICLKTEIKMDRNMIETYVNSLSSKELDKLLKEAKI